MHFMLQHKNENKPFHCFFFWSVMCHWCPCSFVVPMKLTGICCLCLGAWNNKTGTWCISVYLLLMRTSVWYIYQDVLKEDPGAGSDQGTTLCGDPGCYPANYWCLSYGRVSVLAMFSMAIFRAQLREAVENIHISSQNEPTGPFR